MLLDLVELGAEHFKRLFPIRMLGALFARANDDAGRLMEDSHRGFHFIHVLSTRAAGAREGNFQIVRVDLHLLRFDDWEYGDRRGRGVYPARFFRFWDSLNAVHAR